jgi:hypothetical protein
VRLHVVFGPQQIANDADQFLADDVGLLPAATRKRRLIEEDLAPHDFMDPGLLDL